MNLANHESSDDVVKTILHEGVAHYGLRKLFGGDFDTFLDNAYKAAEGGVRKRIDALTEKYGDRRTATEEYMAGLAEDTDFERPETQSWWMQVKRFFLDMMHKLGIGGDGFETTIGDNELRYMLWRSYENLAEPGRYRDFVREAKDVAMQSRLKVGEFEERREPRLAVEGEEAEGRELKAAEGDGIVYRDVDGDLKSPRASLVETPSGGRFQ